MVLKQTQQQRHYVKPQLTEPKQKNTSTTICPLHLYLSLFLSPSVKKELKKEAIHNEIPHIRWGHFPDNSLDISFPCSNLPLRPWPCCVSVITHKVPSSLRGEMFRFQGRFSAGLTPHPSDTDALHLWLVHGQWSWAMGFATSQHRCQAPSDDLETISVAHTDGQAGRRTDSKMTPLHIP